MTLTKAIAVFSVSCMAMDALAKSAEPQRLPDHVGGRVVVEQQDNQKTYVYSWPAIYFETAFSGNNLTLKFDDDQNIFQLIIDNRAPVVINKPGKQDYEVSGLAAGNHKVRLEKLTETQSSTGRFGGFYSSGKALPTAMPVRKHQIEFIGDSFTVGYGNTSPTRECTNDDVYKTTNSQLSFSALTAKAFDADYQVNASSGFGVVRNYNGTSPDKSLLKLYPYTLNDTSVIYAGDWHPQLIVIGLGTNDFSRPLNPGERWTTREALQADYEQNYVAFVKKLLSKNPTTHIVLMASDQANGEIAQEVGKVLAKLQQDGVKNLDSIIFSGLSYEGCHWHPSTRDDQQLSKLLVDYIKAHPSIW